MDTLNGILCFVRSAESGSFAEAARRLGLTPAAVGKNVARLESDLGVRLFQRSTRHLSLTEAGEKFLHEASDNLEGLQLAMANVTGAHTQPAGTLKVSMGLSFGRDYIVPLLPEFLERFPSVSPDWHFDNRPVDLIAEGFDAAVGGGFDISPGVIARPLAPAHRILIASPAYLERHPAPITPDALPEHDGIFIRSPQTGRLRLGSLRNAAGEQADIGMKHRISLNDPEAACRAAELGLGIALVSMPHALPVLERGGVKRVLPDWHVDAGSINVYFSAQKLLPIKTRAFVDFLVESFRNRNLAKRLDAREAHAR